MLLTHSFSPQEYQRRREATLGLARAQECDAVLAFGENRSGLHVTYLNGWAVTRLAYLRLDASGARMWVQFHNHTPYARRTVVDTDVLDVDDSMIADMLAGSNRFATLGTVPARVLAYAQSKGIALVAIDSPHAQLRTVKSPEEIEALRLGAQASDIGAQALIDACVPGATDWDLLAAARSAYTKAGARDHICYICVSDMSAPDRDVPSQVPEGRVLSPTSVVTFELSASVAPEYPGQILRSVFLSQPSDEYVRLHDVAMQARAAVRRTVKAGVPAADLIDAAHCIEDAGFTTTDDLFHGLGMGYLEPVGTSPTRVPPHRPQGNLQVGMSIVIQPNVTTRTHSAGVQTGEMVVVTSDGLEDLHTFKEGLVLV